MSFKRPSIAAVMSVVSLVTASLWPLQAHAFFDDDEARKAIIDLRNKFEAHKQSTEARLGNLTRQAEDGNLAQQRSMLELANQYEQLRQENSRLQGKIEQLQRDVAIVQKLQADMQAAAAERQAIAAEKQRQLEPVSVMSDGMQFSAKPDEIREFDGALSMVRRAEFGSAEIAFSNLLKRFPNTGYFPSALYWLGNAQYANRAYLQSMASHQQLVRQYPDHIRSPEALLTIANNQVELKDLKSAKLTLTQLTKNYPASEAAAAARERLTRLH